MTAKTMEPIQSGKILWEEFLKPLNVTQYRLAKDINVPARRINEIVHGKRSITADTALRLSQYFGLSERFWLNLQSRYDLEREKDRLEGRIEEEVKVLEHKTAQPVDAQDMAGQAGDHHVMLQYRITDLTYYGN
jgi:antitoxin HigA-1